MDKFKLYSEQLAKELKEAISEVEIKANEEDKDFLFDVVASTEDVDRDWEVIKIKGWDTKNWDKNPVILANHQYRIETIIWKGLKFYTSNGVKRLKGVFSKTNPLAQVAKSLYDEWMLKTVSVWFIPLKRDENDSSIIEKAELLEVSFVAVPANPNAVSLDWKAAEVYKKGLEAWLIKEEKEEPETKVFDETDKSFRYRVRDPKDFEDWSFRTIDFSKKDKIKAVIWKLKGETTTTLQSLIFDKEKWKTLDEVKKWVEDHKEELKTKSFEAVEEKSFEVKMTESIAVMQNDVADIKSALKTLADKNANEDWQEELEKKEAELLEKKETIQSIDKAIGDVLKSFKSLKK